MDLSELRAKAVDAFLKGRFERAALLYADYCQRDRTNVQVRVRMGDAWEKSGNREKAIAAYQWAAEAFAREGFLPRAIAASKLVLDLDPHHQEMQKLLADLYARREREASLAKASQEDPEAAETHARNYLTRFNEVTIAEVGTPAAVSADKLGGSPLPEPPRPHAPPKPGDISAELPPELQLRTESAPSSALQAVEHAAASGLRAEAQAAKAVAPGPGMPAAALEPDPALMRVRATLPKIPLFSDLEPNPFRELIERCPLRRFGAGDQVFEEGALGNSFFVICAGSVRVIRSSPDGPKEVAVLPEGSFFGEMAILSDAPRTATVVSASDETQLLEISAPLLKELSGRYPQMAQALKKFCRQRLLANVMNGSALFRPFTKQERRQLIELFRASEVPAGAVILRAGELSEGLYVVLSGQVEVRKGNEAVARLREGELFGEMSLLTRSPAAASVVALRRTSLLRMPREDFNTIMMTHPQILELVSELAEDRRKKTADIEVIESITIDEESTLV
jgi:CRP-like cAMP-binding protein